MFAVNEDVMTVNNRILEFGSPQVLVISTSKENREALSAALASFGLLPVLCSSMTEACKFIECEDICIVFCDDCLPDGGLGNAVAYAGNRQRPIPVIGVSRTGEWDEYLEALQTGAFDYLSLPPKRDELDRVIASALGSNQRPIDPAKAVAAT